MNVKTNDVRFMVSGFNISQEELFKCLQGAVFALSMKYPSAIPPIIIKNASDDFFGDSYDVIYKYNEIPTEDDLRVNGML